MPAAPPRPGLPRGLGRRRALARAALWIERVWPALWPAVGVAGLVLCAMLFGLADLLPPWPRALLPVLTVLAVGALAVRGLLHVRRPTTDDADRRLERASALRHRPLAALADRPAPGLDPAGEAVWQAHLARVAAQLGRLRVGTPRPGLPARDPRALRLGLLVAVLAGLMVAGADAPSRVGRALAPAMPPLPPTAQPLLQAWITPPAYTGLAPRFLAPEGGPVQVPAGSHLTASLTGGRGEPSLSLGSTSVPFRALDQASWQVDHDLGAGGRLQVRRGGATVAEWALAVTPDQPPVAAFPEPPGASQAGRPSQQTRLPWRTEDDYGVVSLRAELRLRDRPAAPPLVVPVPLSGAPKTAKGVLAQDLTAHPWAGLPVVARLVAKDAPGQEGRSEEAGFTLPERQFTHPVARAVIAVRKQLSLTPDARTDAALALDALAGAPEAFDGSTAVLLGLDSTASLLRRGRDADAVEEAQRRLWALALSLEENGPDRTARALEAARQAAREALDQVRKQDTPENRAELERQMAELRAAIERHMQALAAEAQRNGAETPPDPDAQQMTQGDLDRMQQDIQQAMREGRMDDANRQMAELERMLEALQNAKPGQADPQNAERRQRGRQQMGALQDMVQREGGLLDRSQGRAGPTVDPRRPNDPAGGDRSGSDRAGPQRPQPGTAPAAGGAPAEARDGDGRSQRALRRALGELMQQFGDLTGQVPAPLSEADTAMREAGQALADGRDASAGAAQQRAIDALQRGGREMGQQMARQFGLSMQPGQPGEGEGEDGLDGDGRNGQADARTRDGRPGSPDRRGGTNFARQPRDRRDPLGRPLRDGASGAEESGDVQVPDQAEAARSRALQDELRRRGADRTRPQPELDYIERLLKPF